MDIKTEKHSDEGFPIGIVVATIVCFALLAVALRWDSKQPVTLSTNDVPAFNFPTVTGQTLGLGDLKGKVWLADFILIRCTTQCPVMTSAMGEFQKKWKKKGLKLVSFTMDSVGVPDLLKEYVKNAGADATCWYFLTGENKDLVTLANRISFTRCG